MTSTGDESTQGHPKHCKAY